jgi:hypothetical protein
VTRRWSREPNVKGEIAVENVDAKVQCLGDEAKFHMNFYEPIDENGPHCSGHSCLFVHVWVWASMGLRQREEHG